MNTKKIISFFIVLIIILNFNTICFAAPNSDLIGTARNWIILGKESRANVTIDSDWTEFNDLAGVLFGIGIFVILIVGMTIGIRYVFSASSEQKAKIKDNMIPFIIGTVMILGALGIWKFVVELLEGTI